MTVSHINADRYILRVLRTKMRNKAKTWATVSYRPLSLEPHSGFAPSSCRLRSSARSNSVGRVDHEASFV